MDNESVTVPTVVAGTKYTNIMAYFAPVITTAQCDETAPTQWAPAHTTARGTIMANYPTPRTDAVLETLKEAMQDDIADIIEAFEAAKAANDPNGMLTAATQMRDVDKEQSRMMAQQAIEVDDQVKSVSEMRTVLPEEDGKLIEVASKKRVDDIDARVRTLEGSKSNDQPATVINQPKEPDTKVFIQKVKEETDKIKKSDFSFAEAIKVFLKGFLLMWLIVAIIAIVINHGAPIWAIFNVGLKWAGLGGVIGVAYYIFKSRNGARA